MKSKDINVNPVIIKDDHHVIPFVNNGYFDAYAANAKVLSATDWYTYIPRDPALSHLMVPVDHWIIERIQGIKEIRFVFDGYSPIESAANGRAATIMYDDDDENGVPPEPRLLSSHPIAIDYMSAYRANDVSKNIVLDGYAAYEMYMNALGALPYEPEQDFSIPPIVDIMVDGKSSSLFAEIHEHIMKNFHNKFFNDQMQARMITLDKHTYEFKISKNDEITKQTKAVIWNAFNSGIYTYTTKKFYKKISRLHSTEIRLHVYNKWSRSNIDTPMPEIEDVIISYEGPEYGVRLAMALPYIFSLWIRQHDELNNRPMDDLPTCGFQLRAYYHAKQTNAVVPTPIWSGRAYVWSTQDILATLVEWMIDNCRLNKY